MSNSLALAQEAVNFIRSEYGKHYLARLQKIRDDYRKKAEDVRATESESRAFSLKASAYDDEIGYFKTATEIVSNPSIVKRLKDKLKKQENNQT